MVMLRGHVKWFDTQKGTASWSWKMGLATFASLKCVKNFGRGSVVEGTVINFELQETDRGRQVSRIVDIEAPNDEPNDEEVSDFGVPEVDGVKMVPARVKWFDKSKGFGFANAFKSEIDIFLHMEVLRHYGFSDLQSGEAIVIQIVDGPRGKMAGAIHAWDEPKILDETD